MMQPPPPLPYGPPSYGAPVPPPPAGAGWEPERVDVVSGTDFGLVQLRVVPITSGLAIGSLIVGIGSILVALITACFGFGGASAWVAGAFSLLSVLAGGGAVTAAVIAMRQIKRSGGPGRVRFTGRGLAISGIACGAAGSGISLLALVLGVVLQTS
ncbi:MULTISPECIES: hypothetical protein [unclassified Actinoplanes]|uniref:hypothetical protein n=1 Tax=unclassified Actinoplanes TaxID=2626549 RepID=UPI0002FB5F4B|nr:MULTISPECIES: hypothetical protein [unclassified Actinoplanes]SLL97478.1 hypothetical protein ACSP50_0685 [Actinoplanes sp. SE50/110]